MNYLEIALSTEPLHRLPFKYADLGLKIHSSEACRCLTHSKDAKYCLMNSTACILQIRTLGIESHCYLPHEICLIKYIHGSMEGQYTTYFGPITSVILCGI